MANPNALATRPNTSSARSKWLARAKGAGNAIVSTASDAAKATSKAITKAVPGKMVPSARPAQDGIASVVGGELPGALTLGVLGAIDKSRIGKICRDKIGVSAPVLSFGAAVLGRVTGIDSASPVMRRTGTRIIKGMVNVFGLEGGGMLMDAIGSWETRHKGSDEPQKTAGAEEKKPAAKVAASDP